jgi:hypothetical protein
MATIAKIQLLKSKKYLTIYQLMVVFQGDDPA